jgi:hypothetical protein
MEESEYSSKRRKKIMYRQIHKDDDNMKHCKQNVHLNFVFRGGGEFNGISENMAFRQ